MEEKWLKETLRVCPRAVTHGFLNRDIVLKWELELQ
jgi:hypothetical protein